MNVLVTGGFGNIGLEAVRALMPAGRARHRVRIFDLDSRRARSLQRRLGPDVEVIFGDIRDSGAVSRAIAGQDVVLHNAGLVPPFSEIEPERTRAVNVGGSRNLIDAALAAPRPPKILFASSMAVYGPRQEQPPPRRADEAVWPTDHYTRSKVEIEERLRTSGLRWLIMRIGGCPPIAQRPSAESLRTMFESALDSRIEFLHPADAGLAQANAVDRPEAWGKVLLIGGGRRCQMRVRDLMAGTLGATGVGMLPEDAFSDKPLYSDWLDTEESQRLLDYQRHGFEDYLEALRRSAGPARHLMPLLRPFARRYLLGYSARYGGRGLTRSLSS